MIRFTVGKGMSEEGEALKCLFSTAVDDDDYNAGPHLSHLCEKCKVLGRSCR